MRAIDADRLIDDLKHDVAMDQDSLDYEELTDWDREKIQFDKDCKQNAIDLLQNAPTIELRCEDCESFNKTRLLVPQQERKTGRWINVRHDNVAECSRCGITGRAWMNFCFDCGADMRTAKYGTKIDLCIMDEVEGLPSAQQEHTKKEDA